MDTRITKTMGNFIENKSLKLEIVSRISNGEITTADDIVRDYNVTYELAIAFLSDNNTIALIQNYTKAKTNLLFHTKGINKLTELLDSEDNKEVLSSLKLLGQLSNNLKSNGADVNVNINLESLIGNSNNLKSVNESKELENLFKDGNIIEVEKEIK